MPLCTQLARAVAEPGIRWPLHLHRPFDAEQVRIQISAIAKLGQSLLVAVAISRRTLSPPSAPPSALTVPESSSPGLSAGDCAPLAPSGHPAAAAPICPLCLEDVRPGAPGPQAAHDFPCCAAAVHLGCLVECLHHHGYCPTCRRPLAPLHSDAHFRAACIRHGVDAVPPPRPNDCTTRAVVGDYAPRTFSAADAREPSPPAHVLPLWLSPVGRPSIRFCRVAGSLYSMVALAGARLGRHRKLGSTLDLHMVPRRVEASRSPASWRRSLVSSCGRLADWQVDLHTNQSGWVCCGPVAAASSRAPSRAAPVRSVAYRELGSPLQPLTAPTNSRIYVPLLLAAAGRLDPAQLPLWAAHPVLGQAWQAALAVFRERPFVPVQQILAVGQQLILGGQHLWATEPVLQLFLDWAETQGPLISVNTAVDLYANQASGHYIPALVQEALLLVWLGERRALEVLHVIDGWRALPHGAINSTPPLPHAAHPPDAPAAPSLPRAAALPAPASRLCARYTRCLPRESCRPCAARPTSPHALRQQRPGSARSRRVASC